MNAIQERQQMSGYVNVVNDMADLMEDLETAGVIETGAIVSELGTLFDQVPLDDRAVVFTDLLEVLAQRNVPFNPEIAQ